MADTAWQIPLGTQGINIPAGMKNYNEGLASYYQPQKAAADVANTQAEAGLRTAQGKAAGINAETAQIGLDLQRQMLEGMNGATQSGPQLQMPWDPSGAGAGAAPAGGGGIGGYTQASAPDGSGAGAAAAQGGGSIGGAGTAPAAGGGAVANPAMGMAQAQYANTVSKNGVMYPGMGVPLPRMWAYGILQSPNKNEAISKALTDRRLALGQLVAGSMGEGGQVDPSRWESAVRTAYDQGLITAKDAWDFHGHPQMAVPLINSLVEPAQQSQQKAATERAVATATAPVHVWEETEKKRQGMPIAVSQAEQIAANEKRLQLDLERSQPRGIPEPGSGIYYPPTSPSLQGGAGAPGAGAAGAAGAPALKTLDIADPNRTMPATEWASRSMFTEGGAGTGERPNQSGPNGTPTSTAKGGQQFIDGTWLSLIRQHYPEWAKGQSDAQLLAARSNDQISNALAVDYARDNAPQLEAAGVPANAATLKLAHSFGPEGAIKIMRANADTPLSQILSPEAMKANPSLGKMTSAQAWANAVTRFGIGPVDGVTTGAGGAPGQAAPAAAPAGGPTTATTQAPVQSAAGGAPGARMQTNPDGSQVLTNTMTPAEKTWQAENAKSVAETQKQAGEQAVSAQRLSSLVDQARLASQSWTSGKFADHKMEAIKTWDSVREQINRLAGKEVMGEIPKTVGDWEAYNKDLLLMVGDAVKAVTPRVTNMEFSTYRSIMASDTTTPAGTEKIFNDLQGIADWTRARNVMAAKMSSNAPANQFDADFGQNVSPVAFIVHRMSMDDFKKLNNKLLETDAGKAFYTRLLGQMKYAQENGLFDASGTGLPVGAPKGK